MICVASDVVVGEDTSTSRGFSALACTSGASGNTLRGIRPLPINIWYNLAGDFQRGDIYCEFIVWIIRWGLMQVSAPRSGLDDCYDLKLSHDVTKS